MLRTGGDFFVHVIKQRGGVVYKAAVLKKMNKPHTLSLEWPPRRGCQAERAEASERTRLVMSPSPDKSTAAAAAAATLSDSGSLGLRYILGSCFSFLRPPPLGYLNLGTVFIYLFSGFSAETC